MSLSAVFSFFFFVVLVFCLSLGLFPLFRNCVSCFVADFVDDSTKTNAFYKTAKLNKKTKERIMNWTKRGANSNKMRLHRLKDICI